MAGAHGARGPVVPDSTLGRGFRMEPTAWDQPPSRRRVAAETGVSAATRCFSGGLGRDEVHAGVGRDGAADAAVGGEGSGRVLPGRLSGDPVREVLLVLLGELVPDR